MTPLRMLTLADIAQRIGVGAESVRTYHSRAVQNRRNGHPQPGDLPEPDAVFERTPVWLEVTVERWVQARPGRGVGGGRKPARSTGRNR